MERKLKWEDNESNTELVGLRHQALGIDWIDSPQTLGEQAKLKWEDMESTIYLNLLGLRQQASYSILDDEDEEKKVKMGRHGVWEDIESTIYLNLLGLRQQASYSILKEENGKYAATLMISRKES